MYRYIDILHTILLRITITIIIISSSSSTTTISFMYTYYTTGVHAEVSMAFATSSPFLHLERLTALPIKKSARSIQPSEQILQ